MTAPAAAPPRPGDLLELVAGEAAHGGWCVARTGEAGQDGGLRGVRPARAARRAGPRPGHPGHRPVRPGRRGGDPRAVTGPGNAALPARPARWLRRLRLAARQPARAARAQGHGDPPAAAPDRRDRPRRGRRAGGRRRRWAWLADPGPVRGPQGRHRGAAPAPLAHGRPGPALPDRARSRQRIGRGPAALARRPVGGSGDRARFRPGGGARRRGPGARAPVPRAPCRGAGLADRRGHVLAGAPGRSEHAGGGRGRRAAPGARRHRAGPVLRRGPVRGRAGRCGRPGRHGDRHRGGHRRGQGRAAQPAAHPVGPGAQGRRRRDARKVRGVRRQPGRTRPAPGRRWTAR